MRRALRLLGLLVLILIVLGFFFRRTVLTGIGSYLIQSDSPQKADVALVLAGDGDGNRILTAAQLARRGYVSRILVSGPSGEYGHYECDLAIPFAVKAGYPESYFLHFENHAKSTKEEARDAIVRLRELGARKVLIVTSNYHTRRSAKIYRSAAPDLTFVVVAAPDTNFTPDGWWHDREAEKVVFMEWSKTISSAFGI